MDAEPDRQIGTWVLAALAVAAVGYYLYRRNSEAPGSARDGAAPDAPPPEGQAPAPLNLIHFPIRNIP
jgi:hypothetical protein